MAAAHEDRPPRGSVSDHSAQLSGRSRRGRAGRATPVPVARPPAAVSQAAPRGSASPPCPASEKPLRPQRHHNIAPHGSETMDFLTGVSGRPNPVCVDSRHGVWATFLPHPINVYTSYDDQTANTSWHGALAPRRSPRLTTSWRRRRCDARVKRDACGYVLLLLLGLGRSPRSVHCAGCSELAETLSRDRTCSLLTLATGQGDDCVDSTHARGASQPCLVHTPHPPARRGNGT